MEKESRQGKSSDVQITRGNKKFQNELRELFHRFAIGDFLVSKQQSSIKTYLAECIQSGETLPIPVSKKLINGRLAVINEKYGFPSLDKFVSIRKIVELEFSEMLEKYEIMLIKTSGFQTQITDQTYKLLDVREDLFVELFPENYLRAINIDKDIEGVIFIQKDSSKREIMIIEGHHRILGAYLNKKKVKISGWILQSDNFDNYIYSSL